MTTALLRFVRGRPFHLKGPAATLTTSNALFNEGKLYGVGHDGALHSDDYGNQGCDIGSSGACTSSICSCPSVYLGTFCGRS